MLSAHKFLIFNKENFAIDSNRLTLSSISWYFHHTAFIECVVLYDTVRSAQE